MSIYDLLKKKPDQYPVTSLRDFLQQKQESEKPEEKPKEKPEEKPLVGPRPELLTQQPRIDLGRDDLVIKAAPPPTLGQRIGGFLQRTIADPITEAYTRMTRKERDYATGLIERYNEFGSEGLTDREKKELGITRQEEMTNIEDWLKESATTIEQRGKKIEEQNNRIETLDKELEAIAEKIDQGQVELVDEYNQKVAEFNRTLEDIQQEFPEYESLIQEYQDKVEKHKQLKKQKGFVERTLTRDAFSTEMLVANPGSLSRITNAVTRYLEIIPRAVIQTLATIDEVTKAAGLVDVSNQTLRKVIDLVDPQALGVERPLWVGMMGKLDDAIRELPVPKDRKEQAKQGLFVMATVVLPDILDVLIAGSWAKSGVALSLKATGYSPARAYAVQSLGLPKTSYIIGPQETEVGRKVYESAIKRGMSEQAAINEAKKVISQSLKAKGVNVASKDILTPIEVWNSAAGSYARAQTIHDQVRVLQSIKILADQTQNGQRIISPLIRKFEETMVKIITPISEWGGIRPVGYEALRALPGWTGAGKFGLAIEPRIQAEMQKKAGELAAKGLGVEAIVRQLAEVPQDIAQNIAVQAINDVIQNIPAERAGRNLMEWENADLTLPELMKKREIAIVEDPELIKQIDQDIAARQAPELIPVERFDVPGYEGQGMFFSPRGKGTPDYGPEKTELFISPKNPYTTSDQETAIIELFGKKEGDKILNKYDEIAYAGGNAFGYLDNIIRKELQKRGYDSVHYLGDRGLVGIDQLSGENWGVFDKSIIKTEPSTPAPVSTEVPEDWKRIMVEADKYPVDAYLPARGRPTWAHGKKLWNTMKGQYGEENFFKTDVTKNREFISWVIDRLEGGTNPLTASMLQFPGPRPMTSAQYRKMYAMFRNRDYSLDGYARIIAALKGISVQKPKPEVPMFVGPPDVTTRLLLEFEGLPKIIKRGRFEEVINRAKKKGIKAADEALILKAAEDMPDIIDLGKVGSRVRAELIKLNRKHISPTLYHEYGDDFLEPGASGKYHELIYTGPLRTSVTGEHWRGRASTRKYFSHVRAEDFGNNRKILEVQSDLFQQDRFITLISPDATSDKSVERMMRNIRAGKPASQTIRDLGLSENRIIRERLGIWVDASPETIFRATDRAVVTSIKEAKALQKHMQEILDNLPAEAVGPKADIIRRYRPYEKDTASHLRTVREELKRAAEDGKELIYFPTGKTAMGIEELIDLGLASRWVDINRTGRDALWWRDISSEERLTPEDLKVGKVIGEEGPDQEWIITEVIDEDSFKALPAVRVARIYQDVTDKIVPDVTTPESQHLLGEWVKEHPPGLVLPGETFSLIEDLDKTHLVYRLNENDIPKELRRLGIEFKKVSRSGQGTGTYHPEWWEVKVPAEMKDKPIEMFGMFAGFEVDEEGNVTYNPAKAAMAVFAIGSLRGKGLQKQVSKLATKGMTPAQIATQLKVSPSVVKNILRSIAKETIVPVVTPKPTEPTDIPIQVSPKQEELARQFYDPKEDFGVGLQAQKRGVIPWEETDKMAESVKMDISKLANIPRGTVFNAETLEAAKQELRGMRTKVKQLRDNMIAQPGDEALAKKYEEAQALLNRATINVAAVEGELGRALGMVRYESGLERQTKIVSKNVQETMRKLDPASQVRFQKMIDGLDMEDPAQVREFLIKYQEASMIEKIVEYYKSSLYSALTTQFFNITASGLMMTLDIPMRATAGAWDAMKAAVTGKPREVYAYEALRMITGGFNSLRAAGKEAARSLAEEGYRGGTRALRKEGLPIPRIKGLKGKIIRSPFRLAGAADNLERTIKMGQEIHAMAYRLAKQEGHKGIELIERTEAIKADPPIDLMNTIIGKAERVMGYEDLRGVLDSINQLRMKAPALQLILPFFRAIMNFSFVEAYRLTPGRLITTPIKEKMGEIKVPLITDDMTKMEKAKAKMKDMFAKQTKIDPLMENPLTRPEETGRMMVGVAIASLFLWAMMEGRMEVTGPAPRDQKERATFYGLGKKPYSFRIRKADGSYSNWYEYRRMQPLATILFTMHQINRYQEAVKNEPEKYTPEEMEDKSIELANQWIRFVFTEQHAMQGVSRLIEALEGGAYDEGTIAAGARFLRNQLGGFIPNILYSLSRSIDPTIYLVEDFGDIWRQRIPGAQADLIPRRDPFGFVVDRGETPLSLFLNPYRYSRATEDPVYIELDRLNTGVGYPSKVVAGQKLTSKEYDMFLQDYGPRVYNKLKEEFQTERYQNYSEMDKVAMIDRIVSHYRNESRKTLFQHYYRMSMREEQLLRQGLSPQEAYKRAREELNITPEKSEAYVRSLMEERRVEYNR